MQNTATITICVWKLKLLRMETLARSQMQEYGGVDSRGREKALTGCGQSL